MGRKPLPTEIKRLKGTLRLCRTNPDEPQPSALIGDPPEYMDERAKEIWRQTVHFLPRGVVTMCDTGVLETFCNMCSVREKLQKKVNKEGAVSLYSAEINPAFNALVKCNNDIAKAASELGLTPSARQKVAQGYGDAADPDNETLDMFGELDRDACGLA